MLDIETLSPEQDAIITDVAVLHFEDGEIRRITHAKMAHQPDRRVSYETLRWRQNNNMPLECQGDLGKVDLWLHLSNFIKDDKTPIFAKGAHFDFAILENFFGRQGPWHYRQPRDLRTFLSALNYSDRQAPRGATHDPSQDCLDQTAHLLNAIRGEAEFHAVLLDHKERMKLLESLRAEGKWVRHINEENPNLDGFTHVNGEKV